MNDPERNILIERAERDEKEMSKSLRIENLKDKIRALEKQLPKLTSDGRPKVEEQIANFRTELEKLEAKDYLGN
jgi:hypothetical protein